MSLSNAHNKVGSLNKSTSYPKRPTKPTKHPPNRPLNVDQPFLPPSTPRASTLHSLYPSTPCIYICVRVYIYLYISNSNSWRPSAKEVGRKLANALRLAISSLSLSHSLSFPRCLAFFLYSPCLRAPTQPSDKRSRAYSQGQGWYLFFLLRSSTHRNRTTSATKKEIAAPVEKNFLLKVFGKSWHIENNVWERDTKFGIEKFRLFILN